MVTTAAEAERTVAELADLDAEIGALDARAEAEFELHSDNRRTYVDAAVAAYVAGAPDSMELRAALVTDPAERSRSLALAESVGDAFATRAELYLRSGERLEDGVRSLAERRVALDTAAADAARSRDGAIRANVEAVATRDAAVVALADAEARLEVARAEARARIEAAAERFRLGDIERSELERLADRTIAVDDIPTRAYDAYVSAARTVDAEQPGCRISWWALAAIGRVESGHGTSRGAVILPNGDVAPRILGPALTGGPFRAIRDTDGGRLDGDPVWDRAVGPMQFIPSTWVRWSNDANGDGRSDPHNYLDAATASARYLCLGARGRPLDSAEGLRAAALSYNRSGVYADAVLANARRYGGLLTD